MGESVTIHNGFNGSVKVDGGQSQREARLKFEVIALQEGLEIATKVLRQTGDDLKKAQAELAIAKAELESKQRWALVRTNPGKGVALIWTGKEWLRMDNPTVEWNCHCLSTHELIIKSDCAITGFFVHPDVSPAPAPTQAEISALLGRHFAHLDATERERIAALLSVTGPASAPADGCAAEGR